MSEKDFLFYYLCGIPIMIWTATLMLAIFRIWHNNHRDLTEERKKWEEQHRVTNHKERERRVVVRRKRRKPSKQSASTATPTTCSVGSRRSSGSVPSVGGGSREQLRTSRENRRAMRKA